VACPSAPCAIEPSRASHAPSPASLVGGVAGREGGREGGREELRQCLCAVRACAEGELAVSPVLRLHQWMGRPEVCQSAAMSAWILAVLSCPAMLPWLTRLLPAESISQCKALDNLIGLLLLPHLLYMTTTPGPILPSLAFVSTTCRLCGAPSFQELHVPVCAGQTSAEGSPGQLRILEVSCC
jgi:hypothetical protein